MKLYGMIHLPPFPGSPLYAGIDPEKYVDYAVKEAQKLEQAGFDGVVIEDYKDYPYPVEESNPYKLGIIYRVIEAVKNRFNGLEIGLNLLRNNGARSLEVACNSGIDFIRVNAYLETVIAPEGVLYPIAYHLTRKRRAMRCGTKIYADINVKHSRPLIDFVSAARNICGRGLPDGIIITGEETGGFTLPAKVYVARAICRDKEIIVGSGVSHANIALYTDLADAVIVGTSIKLGGVTSNPIDVSRAEKLVKKAKKYIGNI